MTTAVVPDLAPSQWRVTKPHTVEVTRLTYDCEHDDETCGAAAQVAVTWTALHQFGQLYTCLHHAPAAIATALDDSPDDTPIVVEYLVLVDV